MISLIGLGKLGLPLLASFAKHGQEILGIDKDIVKVKALENNYIPFFEKDLERYFEEGRGRIKLSNNCADAVRETDAAIILVNTPSLEYGSFSNEYVFSAIEDIAVELERSDKEDFLVIISSTVMPRTHYEIVDILERESGRKLNEGFGLCYIPDLVALGSVIKDFENPDLVILGASNSKYAFQAKCIYKNIIQNNAPFFEMSLLEAEVAKISLNTYITTKISFANLIGTICSELGADATKITEALGYDRRISPYYFRSGTAYGGTCFPRDTKAFIDLCDLLGVNGDYIEEVERINEEVNRDLYWSVVRSIKNPEKEKIGILGLSFKPDTMVTEQSPGHILYEFLEKDGYSVVGYDLLIAPEKLKEINECDILVITHSDPRLLEGVNFENKIIIDPWKICLT